MKKYILLIILLLTFSQVVYAAENSYPEILGYKITDNSEFVDYVSYGFMMIISIGSVVLLSVLIGAGINFIMAGGDPGKISKAKEMIMNGFIGIVILFSSYWILATINPAIAPEKPELDKCKEGGILFTIDKNNNIFQKCVSQSNKKLDLDGNIINAEWKYEEGAVKEVWVFSGEDYKGTATPVFQDAVGAHGCYIPMSNPSTLSVPSQIKSIYILPRLQGFYFYDKTGYGFNNEVPLFISASKEVISDNFDNKASSFSTICSETKVVENPDGTTQHFYNEPRAVIFEGPHYTGKCSVVYSSKSNSLTTPSEIPDKTILNSYIGDKEMSSVIVYNVDSETKNDSKGTIVLYNSLSCAQGSSKQQSTCEIDVSRYQSYILDMQTKTAAGNGEFPQGCIDSWDEDSYVESIEFKEGATAAVIVIGDNGDCAYLKPSSGNCVNTLCNTGVYDCGTDSGVRPQKIIVIPTN